MKNIVNIIVNADDYGIDENRSLAILKGFELGAVTHTTALVNMPYFRTSVPLIKSAGHLHHMGLHFNLTEGCPLTDEMRGCRFFCNESGMYASDFHLHYKWRLYLPRAASHAIAVEACAQMQLFRDMGGISHHLDSHHHVHTDISVARIIFPIAKRFGFQSVRLSRNLCNGLNVGKRVYKTFFNLVARKFGTWSNWFCAFSDLENTLGQLQDGEVVEVMVHPMYAKGALHATVASSGHALIDSGRPIDDELDFYQRNRDKIRLIYPEESGK